MNAGFVSCDIVGHSGVKSIGAQCARVRGLNEVVRRAIAKAGETAVVWAPGGDGGHLAFLGKDWPPLAVEVILDLHEWARQEAVPLRIVGHVGEVEQTEGADGRIQLVGDGINLVGRLLSASVSGGVMVSDVFRGALVAGGLTHLDFHDPRVIRAKYFPPQEVFLLSIPARIESSWNTLLRLEHSFLFDNDRQMLALAQHEGRTWDIVFYVKRLLQANAYDKQAGDALLAINPTSLAVTPRGVEGDEKDENAINSFLGSLDPETRLDVIRSCQMLERQRNEVLCVAGEAGDSMFVVLRGEIGIFPGGIVASLEGRFLEPPFSATTGETVGEIAFALKRKRTATLIAARETCLLSFNAEMVRTLTRQSGESSDADSALDRFIRSRILKFVVGRASWLVGPDKSGPLRDIPRLWDRLVRHTRRIDCPSWTEAPVKTWSDQFAEDGVYALVSGRLRSITQDRTVEAEDAVPAIFAKVAGSAIMVEEEFRVEEDATILRIDVAKLLQRDSKRLRALIGRLEGRSESLEAAKANPVAYDVFCSYRWEAGSPLVRSVEQALQNRFRFFIDVQSLKSGRFDVQLLQTISRTPNFVLFLTPGSLDNCNSLNDWLRREIAQAIQTHRNIVPILADGFRFPEESTLPEEIRDLARYEAIRYDHAYFKGMIDRLSELLR